MKCTLNPEIEAISGKIGGVLYKTYKRPNGKSETRVYLLPKKENGKYGYERKTPVSENEMAARARFAQVTQAYKNLTDEQKRDYAREWRKDHFVFNGKKYNTFRGYVMARLYADSNR